MKLLVPESAGLPTLKKFDQEKLDDFEPREVKIHLVDPIPTIKFQL